MRAPIYLSASHWHPTTTTATTRHDIHALFDSSEYYPTKSLLGVPVFGLPYWNCKPRLRKAKSVSQAKIIRLIDRAMRGLGVDGKSKSVRRELPSTSIPRNRAEASTRVAATTRRTQDTRGERAEDSRASSEETEGDPSDPTLSALERRKKEIIDNVMSSFMKWLDLNLPESEACQDGDDSSSRKGGPSNGGSSKGGAGQQNARQKKRQQREDSPEGSGGGKDGQDGHGNKRARRDSGGANGPRLACPFYQHDPTACTKSRACKGPGWVTVHRLKEHLYRVHLIPKHRCARCGEAFDSDKILAAHLRSDDRCELTEATHCDGIDEEQEVALKSRSGKDEVKTEEKKWYDVYKILFPNVREELLPSPYYEKEGPRGLDGCIQFLRRQLPPLVRRELEEVAERKFHCVEDSMKKEAVDIIKHLACRLIRSYQYQDPCAGSPGLEGDDELAVADVAANALSAPENVLDDVGVDIFNGDFDLDMLQVPTYASNTDLGYGDGAVAQQWQYQ